MHKTYAKLQFNAKKNNDVRDEHTVGCTVYLSVDRSSKKHCKYVHPNISSVRARTQKN